jgi:hypothetical protein
MSCKCQLTDINLIVTLLNNAKIGGKVIFKVKVCADTKCHRAEHIEQLDGDYLHVKRHLAEYLR